MMKRLEVRLGERSYPIYIGSGILQEVGELCRPLGLGLRGAVITNPTVGAHYATPLKTALTRTDFLVEVLEVPDGETSKSLEAAADLYHRLLGLHLDRRSCIFALGGGVIGDLAGFVAATFLRGLTLIQVPTTLVGQVDSSIGGKVGVNLAQAKNLVGTFYQPALVVSDVHTLQTLPEREFRAGLAEVVKYGVIADPVFFGWVEGNLPTILARDEGALIHILEICCAIKAKIVEADERDKGLRTILNFGHTVGHALEVVGEYRGLNHGEAVALGMTVAARISHAMGLCPEDVPARIAALLEQIGLPTILEDEPTAIYQAIQYDKKVKDDRIHFVLIRNLGNVTVAPVLQLQEALRTAMGSAA